MDRHPSLLQEEVDLAVDDADDHQGEDELEHPREDCVPDQDLFIPNHFLTYVLRVSF